VGQIKSCLRCEEEALNRNQVEAQEHNAMMVTLFQRVIAGQERNTAALNSLKFTAKSLKTTVKNLITQTSIINETIDTKMFHMNQTLNTINAPLANLDRRICGSPRILTTTRRHAHMHPNTNNAFSKDKKHELVQDYLLSFLINVSSIMT